MQIASIFLALFGIVIPIYRYLVDRGLQNQDIRFKTYHELIKKLVQAELAETNPIKINKDNTTGKEEYQVIGGNRYCIMQDRQIAVIFELRNFPEYFEVTKRILQALKEEWKEDKCNSRIISEIEYTLAYIDKYRHCLQRILRFIFLKRLSRSWVSSSISKKK